MRKLKPRASVTSPSSPPVISRRTRILAQAAWLQHRALVVGSLKGRLGPPTVIFQVEHNALVQSFLENTLAKSMNHVFLRVHCLWHNCGTLNLKEQCKIKTTWYEDAFYSILLIGGERKLTCSKKVSKPHPCQPETALLPGLTHPVYCSILKKTVCQSASPLDTLINEGRDSCFICPWNPYT